MRSLTYIALLLASALQLTGAEKTEIYVSPTGSDTNIGSRQHPLKTLSAARDLMHQIRPYSIRKHEAATVYLRGGTYRLHNSFAMDRNDSGAKSLPVTFRAYKNEKVVICGGETFRIGDLQHLTDNELLKKIKPQVRNKVLKLDVSRYTAANQEWPLHFKGYAGWPEIYIADNALHLARWPNNGYAKIAKVIDSGSKPRVGEKPDRGGIFQYSEDAPSFWDTTQEIYLNGYWCYKWSDDILKVASINTTDKTIKLATPHTYGIGGPSGGLYYAINLPEELDVAGEYVFDRKNRMLYMILPNSAKADDTLQISFMKEPLLTVKNATDITFKNITFADNIGNGAEVKDCHRISFKNCTFKNISSTAITINGGSECGPADCLVYNIGRTGISLSGGDRNRLTPAKHYVTDCNIHHYARLQKTYAPAVHLNGVGQLVRNCYMHHAPHNAVLFGGNDHIIENNRIESVCLDTADAGAIYCGRDWSLGGTVIRRNLIAKLGKAEHHNNWGVYLDDVASGIEVSENILIDCASGMLIGGGRNNTITDNLFIRCQARASIYYDNRGTKGNRKVPAKAAEPDSDNVMWKKLRQVPYHKTPWIDRFPYLAELDRDNNPGAPKNAVVSGNRVFNSAGFTFAEEVKNFGEASDNISSTNNLNLSLINGHIRFDNNLETLKRFQKFEIGPRN